MLFHNFAKVASKIAQTTKRLEKSALMGELFDQATDADLSLLARYFAGTPFPLYDERVLNIGSSIVSEIILARNSMSREQWQQLVIQQGDLGTATGIALSETAASTPTLTLAEVQTALELLAITRGNKQKGLILEGLIAKTTALGSTYLIKLIGGELRIGVREGQVEDAIARTFKQPLALVQRANMLLGDIGQTAVIARQGKLEHAHMRLFHPLKFMLASPINELEDIRRSIPEHMLVEDKYDGIRAQAHHTEDRTVLYSRTLDTITHQFPEIIEALNQVPAHVILDGEILAATADKVLPFSTLQKRLGRKKVTIDLQHEVPVVYVIYDVLYYNGDVLLEQSLQIRRRILDSLELQEPLRRSNLSYEHNLNALNDLFDQAKARGNEGLMIKAPTSQYLPGRRGREWLKLKRALATLDVVVTAAEVGHGKRRNVLSDYTFAVRRAEDDPTLLNIGKAYSGLTDQEIAELTTWFKLHTLQRYGRVHLVEPKIVLEVAFDSVQPSPRHKSGYALRFPRIVRLRPDKPVSQIDTLEQVKQLIT